MNDHDECDVSIAEQRERLHSWLRRTHPEASATFVETHVSILALSPNRVWKLKKAVRFPFVDLSTGARRRMNAEREVELNRRFAPDVYLGVVSIDGPDAGPDADVVVEMRRMPDDRRLSSVVRSTARARHEIERIAVELARIHGRARSGPDIDAVGSRDAVLALWERSLAEMQPFVPAVLDTAELDAVARDARRYAAGRELLFRERIADGRIRDGHGDLLADDVFCLDDGPRFLDCLEFDDQLRYGDVVADVAFLAMDLERLGHRTLAAVLLEEYRNASGDAWPPSLADFYVAYRAIVRSKVACLAVDADSTAPGRARSLLALAGGHLARGRVRLVLIGGPPATGKTTLAREVAQRTGWSVLHSDEVRKHLAGIEPGQSARADLDAGLYTPEWTSRTYDALLDAANPRLLRGESVLLDASWSDARRREDVERLAALTSSTLTSFALSAPAALADERARARAGGHRDASNASDASDATTAVTGELRSRFEAWPDALTLDATEPTGSLATSLLRRVGYPD